LFTLSDDEGQPGSTDLNDKDVMLRLAQHDAPVAHSLLWERFEVRQNSIVTSGLPVVSLSNGQPGS
jgi:hypothetical protein